MIKFHVVKEAIQSSSLIPFITNFNVFFLMENHNSKTATIIHSVHGLFQCLCTIRISSDLLKHLTKKFSDKKF